MIFEWNAAQRTNLSILLEVTRGKPVIAQRKKAQLAPQLEPNQLGRLSGRLRGGGEDDYGFLLSSLCLCVMLNKSAFGKYVNC